MFLIPIDFFLDLKQNPQATMSSAATPVQQAASTMGKHGAAVRAADPTSKNLRFDQKLKNYVDGGLPSNQGQWNTYLQTLVGFLAMQERTHKMLVEASSVIAVCNNDKGRHGRIGGKRGKELWDSNYNFKAEINFDELSLKERKILEGAIKAKRGRSYKHYGKSASDRINAAGKVFRAKSNKLTPEQKREARRARDAARREQKRALEQAKLAAMTPEEREAHEQAVTAEKEARKQAEKVKREARKQAKEAEDFQKAIAGLPLEKLQALIAEKQARISAIEN